MSGTACPSGKVRFGGELTAKIALANLQAKNTDRVPVRVYPCPLCGGWHTSGRKRR